MSSTYLAIIYVPICYLPIVNTYLKYKKSRPHGIGSRIGDMVLWEEPNNELTKCTTAQLDIAKDLFRNGRNTPFVQIMGLSNIIS